MTDPGQCEICAAPCLPLPLRGGGELRRCTRCAHLRRDLRRAPARHRDVEYGGEPHLDRIRLLLTHRLLRAHHPGRPASVFEVGYGAGALLRRFLDDGARVAGCDPGGLQVPVDDQVRHRGRLHPVPVEGLAGRAETAGQADLVVAVHVLEHVADPGATLAACQELAAPGGQVQVLTPAGDSLGPRLYGQAWWMLEDPTHVRFFTAASLQRLAADAGLVDVQVRRPVLDSLACDAASLARLGRPGQGPAPARGVLAHRPVLAAAAVSAPVVAAARLALPAARPTLHLIARRSGR